MYKRQEEKKEDKKKGNTPKTIQVVQRLFVVRPLQCVSLGADGNGVLFFGVE